MFDSIKKKSEILYVFLILVFVVVSTQVFFTSAPAKASSVPTVDDIFVTDSVDTYTDTYNTSNAIVPDAGATKIIYVNGRVSDTDGVGTGFADGDLDSVSLVFYRTGKGVGCSEDANDCYQVACSVSANDTDTLNYTCAVYLEYFADATKTGGAFPSDTWTADLTVTDDTSQSDSTTKVTDVSTLLALTLPADIAFGQLALAEETIPGTNVDYVITQAGNDEADVDVSGEFLSCDNSGIIPVGNIEWALTDVGYGGGGSTPLTASAVDTNLAVGYRTGAVVTKNLHWNIKMPNAIGGTCTGNTVISAIAAD